MKTKRKRLRTPCPCLARKNTLYPVPVVAASLRAEIWDLKVHQRFSDVSRRPKEGGSYDTKVRWNGKEKGGEIELGGIGI
jgi:hypothetical protein